ncbi:hypothetical protein AB3S75_009383 [Citrus x aurantiifolia]
MGSKIFLVLGLLVAIVFISSEVAARDLAETSIDHKKNAEKATGRNGVSGAKYGGYGDPPGGGGYGDPPGGGGYGDPPGGGGYGDPPGGGGYGNPRGGGVYRNPRGGGVYPPGGRYCPNGC